MNTRLTIGYALAGVVIAASAITATAATIGIGRGSSAAKPASTAVTAETALVQTSGGSIVPLQPGQQITATEVVQTPAGPVEYVYVDAAPAARGHDEDHDEDEHEARESRSRESDHREGREGGVRTLFRGDR